MRRALWDIKWNDEVPFQNPFYKAVKVVAPYYGEEAPWWLMWAVIHRIITFFVVYIVLLIIGAAVNFPAYGFFAFIGALVLGWAIPRIGLIIWVDGAIGDRATSAVYEPGWSTGPLLGLGTARLVYSIPKDERGGRVIYAGDEHHVLIIGSPGRGKTTRNIVPSVILHDGPVLSTSTREDVLAPTRDYRRGMGNLWFYDPTGRIKPAGYGIERVHWSPLRAAVQWPEAVKVAHQMTETMIRSKTNTRQDPHWGNRARSVLAVLLHAAALGERDMATVLRWTCDYQLDGDEGLPEVLSTADEITLILSGDGVDSGARHALDLSLRTGNYKERVDVLASLAVVLEPFSSDDVLASTAPPHFDPDAFIVSRDTLYIAINPDDQERMAPLVIGFIHDIMQACYRYRETHNAPPPNRVLFALDELARMAGLPALEQYLNDGRANGITILAAIQDFGQLETIWGKSMKDQAFTRFRSWVLYPGSGDKDTLELVSLLIGNKTYYETVESQGTSRALFTIGRQAHRSTSKQPYRRPVLEASDITAIPQGMVLVRRDEEWGYLKTATGDQYVNDYHLLMRDRRQTHFV